MLCNSCKVLLVVYVVSEYSSTLRSCCKVPILVDWLKSIWVDGFEMASLRATELWQRLVLCHFATDMYPYYTSMTYFRQAHAFKLPKPVQLTGCSFRSARSEWFTNFSVEHRPAAHSIGENYIHSKTLWSSQIRLRYYHQINGSIKNDYYQKIGIIRTDYKF